MQSQINKRVIPQQNMTFDYTTPDLKVVAQVVAPSVKTDLTADMTYLQQILQTFQNKQRYTLARIGSLEDIGNTLERLSTAVEQKRLQSDQDLLQAIGPYLINFRKEDYDKLKTKKGKDLYIQFVASKYFKNLEDEIVTKLETDWADLSLEELDDALDQYFSEKAAEAAPVIPEEVRDQWWSQASVVTEYLKVQIKGAKYQIEATKQKQLREFSDESLFNREYTSALNYLLDDINEFQKFAADIRDKYIAYGKDLTYELEDGTTIQENLQKQIDALYTAADGIVEGSNLSDEMKVQLKQALYKQINQMVTGVYNDFLQTNAQFEQIRTQMELQDYMEKIVSNAFKTSNISTLVEALDRGFSMVISGEADMEIYEAHAANVAQTLHLEYQRLYDLLKNNEQFVDLPSRELRLMVARQFVQTIGEEAVKRGLPELLDFVNIPDINGISLSKVQDKDLQNMIASYREAAEENRNIFLEEFDKAQTEFIEQQKQLMFDNLATGVFTLSLLSSPEDLAANEELLAQYTDGKIKTAEEFQALPVASQLFILSQVKAGLVRDLKTQIITNEYLDGRTKDTLLGWVEDYGRTRLFADKSDPTIYSELKLAATAGQVTPDYLLNFVSFLDETDFKEILGIMMKVQQEGVDDTTRIFQQEAEILIDTYANVLQGLSTEMGLGAVVTPKAAKGQLQLLALRYLNEKQQAGEMPNTSEFIQYVKQNAGINLEASIILSSAATAKTNLLVEKPENIVTNDLLVSYIPVPPEETGKFTGSAAVEALNKILTSPEPNALKPIYNAFDAIINPPKGKIKGLPTKRDDVVAKFLENLNQFPATMDYLAEQLRAGNIDSDNVGVQIREEIYNYVKDAFAKNGIDINKPETFKLLGLFEDIEPEEVSTLLQLLTNPEQYQDATDKFFRNYNVAELANGLINTYQILEMAVKEQAMFNDLDYVIMSNPLLLLDRSTLRTMYLENLMNKYNLPPDKASTYLDLYILTRSPSYMNYLFSTLDTYSTQ